MATSENADELAMLPVALYREDVFTDRKVGVIRVLTPVLMPAGVFPLAFEITAGSLAEAVASFGSSAKAAVERAAEELQELRRQAASSLVVTDRMPGGLVGPPRPPGLIRP
jgi:hypothetical protein